MTEATENASDYWLAKAADKRLSAAISATTNERRSDLRQAKAYEQYAAEDEEIDAAFDAAIRATERSGK